jgi:hypothetical protein
MKKIIVLFIFLAIGFQAANAQVFAKGTSAINVGIGFGNTYYLGGSYYKFVMPAISASYEYGIVEVPMGSSLTGVVSIGGFLGWSSSKYQYNYWDNVYYMYNFILISARGNYHFIFNDKFDTYAGISLGYIIVNGSWKGSGTHPNDYSFASSKFYPGFYIGGRYYFNQSIGVFAELGYMLTVWNMGVSFKF